MSGVEIAIVTGASGGIGADVARILARRGLRLGLVSRDETKLRTVAAEIATAGGPAPLVLPFDLARPETPASLEEELRRRGFQVSILINNAGFGLVGRAAELSRAQQLEMIDLNIRALVDLTLRFSPDLIARKGRLMNVASIAAFLPGPGMAVYYATKAFVLSFTEAMAEELKGSGVTATALCPGITPTGFQSRAGFALDVSRFAAFVTSSMAVAEAGVEGMFAGKRVIVPGLANRAFAKIAPLLPHGVVLPTIFRKQTERR